MKWLVVTDKPTQTVNLKISSRFTFMENFLNITKKTHQTITTKYPRYLQCCQICMLVLLYERHSKRL